MSIAPRAAHAAALAALPALPGACVPGARDPLSPTLRAEIVLDESLLAGIDGPVALQVLWQGRSEVFDVLCDPPEQRVTWSWERARQDLPAAAEAVVVARLLAVQGRCEEGGIETEELPGAVVLASAEARASEDEVSLVLHRPGRS